MERILCEKPKTFYNVVSGEKIADGVAAYVGFANGWYSCVFADGRSGLYDSSGRLAAEDFDAAEAAGKMCIRDRLKSFACAVISLIPVSQRFIFCRGGYQLILRFRL